MEANLWKPEYALDIEVIDEQHLRFFEICNDLGRLCLDCKEKGMDRQKIIRAVFELRLYAFLHFHTEETLMVKYAFPHCNVHFREHDRYLESLRDFVAQMGLGSGKGAEDSDAVLADLAHRLGEWAADWWAEHIMRHDQQYAKYVQQGKGRVRAG